MTRGNVYPALYFSCSRRVLLSEGCKDTGPMTSKKLIVSTAVHGIVTVTLNRPDKGNALDRETLAILIATLDRLDEDASVRVVILRGNGKHFCSGADVRADLDGNAITDIHNSATIDRACHRLNSLSKPTIAEVHGACIGGGLGLAACCDVVLATPDAFFAIPEVRLGFPPAALMPIFLATFGPRFLRHYLLSGDRFGVEQARLAGLVHGIHDAAQVDAALAKITGAFLGAGPKAVTNAKALLFRLSAGNATEDLHGLHARWIESEEAREGIASFKEKRHPSWDPSDGV
jgi:methylglutaconyl-CoA hydratase